MFVHFSAPAENYSRAVKFALNEEEMTVTQLWSY
ncbi:aryl-sulfate sulfotransferase, partial [Pseudomonadota bacterium]